MDEEVLSESAEYFARRLYEESARLTEKTLNEMGLEVDMETAQNIQKEIAAYIAGTIIKANTEE